MNLPFAAWELGDALLLTLEIFLFVIWVWIFITIVVDVFRDHELSGWGKAAWLFFLIIIPFLSALIYLIARGGGMQERAIKEQQALQQATDQYIRSVKASPADDIAKLQELKEKGALTDAEFDAAKAKVLSES
jgi:hypothetical protein